MDITIPPTTRAPFATLREYKATMFIYLDTCCLNRPYDDPSQPRIQLETAAVLAILQRLKP